MLESMSCSLALLLLLSLLLLLLLVSKTAAAAISHVGIFGPGYRHDIELVTNF